MADVTGKDFETQDNTLLNVKEKVDFLFKNYLGFPNTKQTHAYYQEEAPGTRNNYVDGRDVFINPIPAGNAVTFTTIFDATTGSGKTFNDISSDADLLAKINLPDAALSTNDTGVKVEEDSTGTILRYTKITTTDIPDTKITTANGELSQSYYIPGRAADGTADPTKNALQDALQGNVEQYMDAGTKKQPYKLELMDTNEQVFKGGETGGNAIVDVKNGVINFTDIETTQTDYVSFQGTNQDVTPSRRLSAGAPVISFCKYKGQKGISSVIQSSSDGNNTFQDISVNRIQTNGVAIGSYFADLSAGILLDLCANRLHEQGQGAAIVLPKGTNAQRPWQNGNSTYDAQGALRYNTETKQFEGFSSESWQGLGGVTDIAQKSKITAQHDATPNGQDRKIRVFTDGSLNMVFDGSGNVAIGRFAGDQNAQGTGFQGKDCSFNDNLNFSVHGDMSMNGVLYVPTLATDSNEDAAATTKFVRRAISNLINNAPDTLDTLAEIADVLGDPANDPSGNSPFSVLKKLEGLTNDVNGLAVNTNMQKLFEIQTQQPGKFNFTDKDEKAAVITLKWAYNDIRATHDNVKASLGLRAITSSTNDSITASNPVTTSSSVSEIIGGSTNASGEAEIANYGVKASKLPYIHEIAFDISCVPQTAAEAGLTGAAATAYDNIRNSKYVDGNGNAKWTSLTGNPGLIQIGSAARLDAEGKLVLANNEDYDDGDEFKKLIIAKVPPENLNDTPLHNVLGRDSSVEQGSNKFSIRIYGTNFSENFPEVEDRALYINDISFAQAGRPVISNTSTNSATPIVRNGTDYDLSLNGIIIERSESGVPNSAAKVSSIKYVIDISSDAVSLRSATVAASAGAINKGPFVVDSDGQQDGDTIEDPDARVLSDLSAGTLYDLSEVQMRNDINSSFGAVYSVGSLSNYTHGPKSTSATSDSAQLTAAIEIGPVNGGVGGNKTKNILLPDDTTESSVIFLDLSSANIIVSDSSRNFEVTAPSATAVAGGTPDAIASEFADDSYKLGKGMDGVSDSIVATWAISHADLAQDISKPLFNTHGFDNGAANIGANAGADAVIKDADISFNCVKGVSMSDPYSTDDNNKGFRIAAQVRYVNSITADMRDPDGDGTVGARGTAYSLSRTITPHASRGGSAVTDTIKFMIDASFNNAGALPQPECSIPTDVSNGIYVEAVEVVNGLPRVSETRTKLFGNFTKLNTTNKLVDSNKIFGSVNGTVGMQQPGTASTAVDGDNTLNYTFANYADISGSGEMLQAEKDSAKKQWTHTWNASDSYSQTNSGASDQSWSSGNKAIQLSINAHNLSGQSATAATLDCSTNFLHISSGAAPPSNLKLLGAGNDVPGANSTLAITPGNWVSHPTTSADWQAVDLSHAFLSHDGKFKTNNEFKYPNVETYNFKGIDGLSKLPTLPAGGQFFEYRPPANSGYRWALFQGTIPDNDEAATPLTSINASINKNIVSGNNLFDTQGGNGVAYVVFTDSNGILRTGSLAQYHNENSWLNSSALTSLSGINTATDGALQTNGSIKFGTANGGLTYYVVVGLKDAY